MVALDSYGTIDIDNYTGSDLIIKGLADTGIGVRGGHHYRHTSRKKAGTENVYLVTKYERQGKSSYHNQPQYTDNNRNNIISQKYRRTAAKLPITLRKEIPL